MKKIIATLLILVLLASVPVFGLSENIDDAAYIDSTWINYDPDYVIWMVILTPFKDRANVGYDISSIIKRQIETGLNDAVDNFEEITASFNTEKIKYELKTAFDVTVTDTEVKLLEVKEGIKLRLKVDVGLKEGDPKPLVIHSVESRGEWLALKDSEVWVNEDNTLTMLLDSFCPIMVLFPTDAPLAQVAEPEITEPEVNEPVITKDNNFNWPIAIIIGVSIIGLALAAFFFNIYETKKNNSMVFFALQRLKLNIEIAIARRRAR